MFENLHLLRPWWLLAIPLVLGLLWLWFKQGRQHNQFAGRIDPVLLEVLLDTDPTDSSKRLPWLVSAGCVLAVLALAGPSWERLPQPVERDGDGLVLVLDLSLSMYVRDIQPSRLVRAQQKITDVLRQRTQGFTGLIAYAGDAHIVAPLTDDTETITNLLASLSPEMMPVLGSDTGAAIALAQDLLRSAGMAQGRILLVTDGIDRIADVSALRTRDYPLSILGIGTAEGAPIPLDFAKQPGRVLQTQQGDIIRARLDDERLREVADLGYGIYRTAQLGDADLQALLSTALPGDDPTIDSERQFDQWADRGYLLALLLLPLAALGFRKGTFATLAPLIAPSTLLIGAALLLSAPPAQAGWWQDLWERADQQAHRALIEGSPERAATLFEDEDWRAIANYRSGEYEAASQAFAEAIENERLAADANLTPLTPTYNHGNALARLGAYEQAIEAYDSVLASDPAHEDAAFNRELVAKLLEQQQQASEQDNDEQQDNQGQQGEQSREDESQQNNDPNEPQEPDSESQTGENEEQQEQNPQEEGERGEEQEQQESLASRDEDAEAMEQWLRRVPDDPGGLLRRKFQYETNARLRSGEARAREREKIW